LLLVLPVALLAVAFAQPDLNEGFVSHLWFVFAIGVHVWWGVLTVFAVRETYRFTLAQAFLTVLLPLLIGLPVAFLIYLVLTVVA
jgi:ABC-type Fe3+ transport system permease subunit